MTLMERADPQWRWEGWTLRKIFQAELSADSGRAAELILPAAPYAMLDALEKLRLEEGEAPRWELTSIFGCRDLVPFLDHSGSLFELNALCQQLALLNEGELAVVEALAKLECDRPAPIPMSRLIDMAYSTDCCYRVEEAVNDETLGRFCAPNGFVPEVDGLADEAFELLDFAKIGQEFRHDGGGVFTSRGYVQRHSELRQVYDTLDLTPKRPDYAILVQTASGGEVSLPYPLGEPAADGPVRCLDCVAPSLTGLTGTLGTWNLLANRLMELEVDGELPKYKAVLDAVQCDEVGWALNLADELGQYAFSPELLEPDDVARANLARLLPEQEAQRLLPHVNLWQYGQAVIQEMGGSFTGYGLIRPHGGGQTQGPTLAGMEMR